MLSFLSVSAFATPSNRPSGFSDPLASADESFWNALEALGFTPETLGEDYAVLDARRWESASRKLGERVSYIDVSGNDESGVAVRSTRGQSFFVDIMQQFCECLLDEMDALSQIEKGLPALRRHALSQGPAAALAVEAAEKRMMQFHALIPARLSEFRRWAETYDVLPEARSFFFEYTRLRSGQGQSIDALFRKFDVT
jgi:hypothetical protein